MSRQVAVHPLVVVNVSDHVMREIQAKTPGSGANAPARAIGVLLGIQEGSKVALIDAIEAIVTPGPNSTLVLNKSHIERRVELVKAIYPRYEVLGWYSGTVAREPVTSADLHLQKQMQQFNESPLYLTMYDGRVAAGDSMMEILPSSPLESDKSELPMCVYETVLEIVQDTPLMSFVEMPFSVDTTEAERITVDLCVSARTGSVVVTSTNGNEATSGSTFDHHFSSLRNAVDMLKKRVVVIQNFLMAVKAGSIPADQELLREISCVLGMLPVMDKALLSHGLEVDLIDTRVVATLANVTKGLASLGVVIEKFKVANPSKVVSISSFGNEGL